MRVFKKFKRKSLYHKSLVIFTALSILLGLVMVSYVYKTAVIYERNLVDNYITYLASSGKLSESVSDSSFKVSSYEKKNAKITDGVKKLYKSDNIKIKKNNKESQNDLFVYDLYNGDKLISTVSLKKSKTYTRMALLTIDEWEVVDTKTYFDEGLFAYEITIPENYELKINDTKAKDEDITDKGDVKGLEELTKYVKINPSVTYKINNLVYEPEIKILDENKKEVKYTVNDNKIVVNKEFKKISNYDDLKGDLKDNFDVLDFAKDWSLYLSKDLSGTNYGFYNLSANLIKDSKKYEFAYNWSHNVDITFTSRHTLKNPPFSNEKVSDCIVYNENAFSCHIYLEKNMVVSGNTLTDTLDDRFYFIYYDGGYKFVDSIAKDGLLESQK